MIHKIIYIRFYDWQRKKKYKWIEGRSYVVTILPELFLIFGTLFAAAQENGHIHLEHRWQEIMLMIVGCWGFGVMAVPLNFGFGGEEGTIRREVRKELSERPRYWKRATAAYLLAIVMMVATANIIM